jgi:hypothetical protein
VAGEKWLQIVQVGKEVTEGTPVPATRKLYTTGNMSRQRAPNLIKFNTGTRDNQRDAKLRASTAMGTLDSPISADELIETLLNTLQAGVTPTALASTTPSVSVTPTQATTGGTIAAGVITVTYTVVGPAGESLALTLPTVTTTTATSTITVPAVTPLPAGSTGPVNYYLTAPGGAAATATFAGTNATGAAITLTAPGNGTQFAPTVAPTGAYKWVFKPGNGVDPQTYEWFDGYRAWRAFGCKMEDLKFTGDVKADTKVTGTYWARDLQNSATVPAFTTMSGPLADRVPSYIQGWESKLYLDPIGAVAGTTNVPQTMALWDVTLKNNQGRKYWADNTTAAEGIILGELGIQAGFTLEGNAAGFQEYQNWDAGVKRLARIELGNNGANLGTTNVKPKVWIDIPGVWTATDLTPENDGTKAYKFTYDYQYDVTNAFGIQITVFSSRATAY